MGAPSKRVKTDDRGPATSPVAARGVLLCVAMLFALGLTMLVSIGIGRPQPLHYPVRQALYGIVAVVGCVVTAHMPTSWWKRLLPWMVLGTAVLLIMARWVGRDINGAHRWLNLGPVSFQPSEFGKLTALVWLATWLSVYRRRSTEFLRGFILPASGLGLICLLVLIGPDYGTTVLIGGTGLLVMFIGGTHVGYLAMSMVVAVSGLGGLILFMKDQERLSRIISFMNPEQYANDEAYQLMNSLYAIMQGGLFGKGIGQSLQKHSYLPEAHTDFILAIIAEELGLIGTFAVLGLFLALFLCGLQISWRCRDPFGRLLAFGITLLISLQAIINIGVVTGSMPTKGLPLPFVSYGGSSLVFTFAMIGILVRIATGTAEERGTDRVRRDSRQWI